MRVEAWLCAHPSRLAAEAMPAAAPAWPAFLTNCLLETDCMGPPRVRKEKIAGDRQDGMSEKAPDSCVNVY